MRLHQSLAPAILLAACGQSHDPRVEDVAANNMSADDVTIVEDDSASGNESDAGENGVDPD